jgi:hypothetical protein
MWPLLSSCFLKGIIILFSVHQQARPWQKAVTGLHCGESGRIGAGDGEDSGTFGREHFEEVGLIVRQSSSGIVIMEC